MRAQSFDRSDFASTDSSSAIACRLVRRHAAEALLELVGTLLLERGPPCGFANACKHALGTRPPGGRPWSQPPALL